MSWKRLFKSIGWASFVFLCIPVVIAFLYLTVSYPVFGYVMLGAACFGIVTFFFYLSGERYE